MKNNKYIYDSIAFNLLYSNLKSVNFSNYSATKYNGLKRNFWILFCL